MNLLITGAWQSAYEHIPKIESYGHRVAFMQQEKENLPCKYDWVEGVICNGLFLHHNIKNFTNLKYIQLTSAGYDRVPVDYIKQHNIEIYNARGVYSIPMAEFAVCGVLDLYKQSRFFAENQKEHKWNKCRTIQELNGKIVCIVGCGSVGTECAKRFKAFGCHVLGVDLKPYVSDVYETMVTLEKFDEISKFSNIVVITLPLTEQTKYLMNTERLSKLQNGAVVVNIARGGIVDTDALVEALKDGRLYAVLDVFEDEPLDKNSPLWDFKNVIIVPHNSFVGDGNQRRILDVIMRNLKRNEMK